MNAYSNDIVEDISSTNLISITHHSTFEKNNDELFKMKNYNQSKIYTSTLSSSILYLLISIELFVSFIIFIKLGFEYLKSNKPYYSKSEKPLVKFS